ncbi:DNA polymerase III subunit gamma/tau [Radicibacter daui]|uniref:DNA polymerase III subunit gamma/tau n=1 Tax=Radicibacter daui TaxID=3064829 RepID=UPI004046E09E
MTDAASQSTPADVSAGTPYRVLARKYRPRTFKDMIGQEALVRTLTNAIRSGRLAHAFMLTGVRGIGKTTSARIIARALNCVGPDGTGGPTPEPCGECVHCRSILEDRHVDVIEMDAASHTGVDDIREIIDAVRYPPAMARFKIYIIDEVHMLSKNAFNALLKTLEEPPEHVKFLFATTEIRKVPVTVLSRCQRFDLRRIDAATLAAYFTQLVEREGVKAEPSAIALISRAADGSARDGLSLLDQAIALSDGTVLTETVRDMLGLADRTRVVTLFETLMQGKATDVLDQLAELHAAGADPEVVLQDLLEVAHTVTRIKVSPATALAPSLPEAEREVGTRLARSLSMPVLTRAWQMLLKGLEEVQRAPLPQQAAEMALIRLCFAAELPPPGDLAKAFLAARDQQGGPGQGAPQGGGGAPGGGGPHAQLRPALSLVHGNAALAMPTPVDAVPMEAAVAFERFEAADAEPPSWSVEVIDGGEAAGLAALEEADAGGLPASDFAPTGEMELDGAEAGEGMLHPMPADFPAMVRLFETGRERLLAAQIRNTGHLISYDSGRVVLRPAATAPKDMLRRMGQLLEKWTGEPWAIEPSSEQGEPTLYEQEQAAFKAALDAAAANPVVKAALAAFPGATIQKLIEKTSETPEP